MTKTKRITLAQVRSAIDRADRADLAVERHQEKSGYGRSNEKTRELRNRAQSLRNQANELNFRFNQQ